jgi:hypothetical protein
MNWWPDVSDFCENFKDFSIFLGYPRRILGGITWRLRKEPPINNSKIRLALQYRSCCCFQDIESIRFLQNPNCKCSAASFEAWGPAVCSDVAPFSSKKERWKVHLLITFWNSEGITVRQLPCALIASCSAVVLLVLVVCLRHL